MSENKKRCVTCGAEFEGRLGFCPECGEPTGKESEESSDEPSVGDRRTMAGGRGAEDRFRLSEAGGEAASLGEQGTSGRLASVGDAVTMSVRAASGGGGQPLAAGESVEERYEILEEIGRGGFARVWKARDRKLERLVALKRLTPEALSGPESARTLERFRREAQAVASLNHRNIVGVYDRGEDAAGPYIVMELVEGGSLRDLLKARGKLDVAEAVGIACAVARGLDHAHRKNLVHRDIKPANILLSKEGGETIPKIADFGLARAGVDTGVSMSGYGMGTQAYMPPEQRRDAKSVNHTADLYALGKTLYEMVTGMVPDDVDADLLPPGLKEVVKKCVRPNPDERYFSAADLLKELERAGAGGAGTDGKGPAVAAKAGNVCTVCGKANAERVRFCVGCGAGLVRTCPECGGDVSVHNPFCGVCGTDVKGFERYRDGISKMEKYAKDKQWGRVLKEHGLLPSDIRMAKVKGRDLVTRAARLKVEADRGLEELEGLRKAVGETVAAGRWPEALLAARSVLALDAQDAEMSARLPQIEAHADDAMWGESLAAARTCEGAGQLEEAACCVRSYLRDHPEGRHQEAGRAERDRLEGLAALEAERVRRVGERDFKGAERQLASMVQAGLSGDGAAALRAHGQSERGAVALQRRLRWRRAGQFALLGLVLAALLAGAAQLFETWRDRQAGQLLAEAGEAKAKKEWPKVLALADETLSFRPGHAQMAGLRKEACEALAPSEGGVWISPATGMVFVWVPAVRLWVGKFEVTNGEYRKMSRWHSSKGLKKQSLNADRQPVVQVGFADAKAYVAWMNGRDRDRLCGGVYRLPTEAEWQVFATCGDERVYPWGNTLPPKFGNYSDMAAQRVLGFPAHLKDYNDKWALTCEVEQSGANDWGLYGVGGNVWECCVADPARATFGAWRGASWANGNAGDLRCAFRCPSDGSVKGVTFGFRVVVSR